VRCRNINKPAAAEEAGRIGIAAGGASTRETTTGGASGLCWLGDVRRLGQPQSLRAVDAIRFSRSTLIETESL
jgi:hypothetical protein